jgi:hypothetical protein
MTQIKETRLQSKALELRRRTSAILKKETDDELHLEDIKEEHEDAEASPVKLIRDELLVFETYSDSEIIGLARTTSSRNVNSGTTPMNDRSPMTNRSLRSNQTWKQSFGEVLK